ncbi:MAG: hypothetical protein J3Q66DRAFT_115349 [Benniella sp.]|nr:MAG: hypothetical protein J3Q66DRAFT_115349 [Benniella sp.]
MRLESLVRLAIHLALSHQQTPILCRQSRSHHLSPVSNGAEESRTKDLCIYNGHGITATLTDTWDLLDNHLSKLHGQLGNDKNNEPENFEATRQSFLSARVGLQTRTLSPLVVQAREACLHQLYPAQFRSTATRPFLTWSRNGENRGKAKITTHIMDAYITHD